MGSWASGLMHGSRWTKANKWVGEAGKEKEEVKKELVGDSHALVCLGQVSLPLGAALPSWSCFPHGMMVGPWRL